MPNEGIFLAAAGGAGTLLFGAAALATSRRSVSSALRSRVRELRDYGRRSSSGAAEVGAALGERVPGDLGGENAPPRRRGLSDRLLPDSVEDRRRFQAMLARAGWIGPDVLGRFFALRMAGLVVPFVAALAAVPAGVPPLHVALPAAVVGSALGWLLPRFMLDRRIAARRRQIRRALPDFMDLLIVCLQSGMSLPAALQRVGDEIALAHPALARELEIIHRETSLGGSIDGAFARFAERTELEAVKNLATVLQETRRFGSEIVQALRSQADSMRFQREQAAEENAQKASVKILFPMLLLILPAVFVVLAGPAVIQIQKSFSAKK
jgi:tight adherence protein C